ncbi:hypothetical protein BDQ12DRAFT_693360 [Crucibulum laeve]|uniref:Uncharacterized protein n=1 Tax=Crucibulum laeve TaxID=68775 RepID=A0A5C3LFK2_9AGAR|nr:hypothetical protein BDQ12DRAFT_693360 [Crucibulum laeve]
MSPGLLPRHQLKVRTTPSKVPISTTLASTIAMPISSLRSHPFHSFVLHILYHSHLLTLRPPSQT